MLEGCDMNLNVTLSGDLVVGADTEELGRGRQPTVKGNSQRSVYDAAAVLAAREGVA